MGIEPTWSAWKAGVLPLNYTRFKLNLRWWRGEDSNLRRQSRQIYSLIPLAAREPLQYRVSCSLSSIRTNVSTKYLKFVCGDQFIPSPLTTTKAGYTKTKTAKYRLNGQKTCSLDTFYNQEAANRHIAEPDGRRPRLLQPPTNPAGITWFLRPKYQAKLPGSKELAITILKSQ